MIREWIAGGRIQIEQVRLRVLKTAWMIDRVGTRGTRTEISAVKVAAANLLTSIADDSLQLFGAAGFTNDWPNAGFDSMGTLDQKPSVPFLGEGRTRWLARQR